MNTHRHQRGASLLEVMISVLILAIGLLGIAAMQATALRNTQGSLERSQAVIQSYAILDSMRANRAVALAGGYNLPMACTAPSDDGTLAASDQIRWINSLQAEMGATACGSIACAAGIANCSVSVQWSEARASDAGATGVIAGDSARTFVTGTTI